MTLLHSPRGSLSLAPAPGGLTAVFQCDEPDWLQEASDAVELTMSLRHPALPDVRDVVRGDDRLKLTYCLRPGAAPISASIDAVRAVADVADGVGAVTDASKRFPCGPFHPLLLARAPDGSGQLVAPCLWGIAYAFDQGARGRAMTTRHFITSRDSLFGARSARTETFFLAYALFEALTGQEPFPGGDDMAYLTAVRDGAALSLAALRPDLSAELVAVVARALASAPEERPAPAQFATLLRARLA